MNDGLTLKARSTSTRLLASAAACCIFALSAFGQANLPNDLVSANNFTEAQRTAIKDYFTQPNIQLRVPEKLKAARDTVLQPLGVQSVSALFRQELWKNIGKTAGDMIKAPDEVQLVNGLRIAGEVATTSSVELIPPHLASKKPSIRYAASFAIMRAFEHHHDKAEAMGLEDAKVLIAAITVAMKVETDAFCFDSMVRTLAAAGSDRQVIRGAQADALKALANTCAEILQKTGDKAIDDVKLEAFVRALTSIRDSFTRLDAPAAWTNDGAQFGGDALVWVYRQLRAGNPELASIKKGDTEGEVEAKKAARQRITQLVTIAESTLTLARQLRGNANQTTGIAAQIAKAETEADAKALADMDLLLKDKLIKEFGLASDRFLK